jgi:hypothetical protein
MTSAFHSISQPLALIVSTSPGSKDALRQRCNTDLLDPDTDHVVRVDCSTFSGRSGLYIGSSRSCELYLPPFPGVDKAHLKIHVDKQTGDLLLTDTSATGTLICRSMAQEQLQQKTCLLSSVFSFAIGDHGFYQFRVSCQVSSTPPRLLHPFAQQIHGQRSLNLQRTCCIANKKSSHSQQSISAKVTGRSAFQHILERKRKRHNLDEEGPALVKRVRLTCPENYTVTLTQRSSLWPCRKMYKMLSRLFFQARRKLTKIEDMI